MANFPTAVDKGTAVTSRALEVTAADFTNGMNECHSNPGVGIGTDNGSVAQSLPNWTLLDQDGAARNPQITQLIGGVGFVDRSSVGWPSSGGVEGKGDLPIDCIVNQTQAAKDGDPSVDGSVASVDGQALLNDLAVGWVSGTAV